MSRLVTLFTGQWGDHFDVDRALAEPNYVADKWALLAQHGRTCQTLSTHLVGQAVCDLIDERHQAILPADGHGDINFEEIIVALNDIGYRGPLSVEWEDGRMDRVHSATTSSQK